MGVRLQLHGAPSRRRHLIRAERDHIERTGKGRLQDDLRKGFFIVETRHSRQRAGRHHLRGRRAGAWRRRSSLHDLSDHTGRSVGMTGGVYSEPEDTLLTSRALDYLSAGPADVVDLIGHICSLPGAPRIVAEHMAQAMFSGRREFVRGSDGRWMLSDIAPRPYTVDRVSDIHRALATGRRSKANSAGHSAQPLHQLSYVVVDTETTGGRAWGADRITEIAAVVVRNGEIMEMFETLINP